MKMVSILALLLVLLMPLGAQEGIQFSVAPSASIPLGPLADGLVPYKTGGGAALQGDWALPFAPFLRGGAVVGYANLPTLTGEVLSMVRLGASVSYPLPLAGKLGLELGAAGGYNLGLYDGSMGSNPWAEAQAGFSLRLTPSLSLGLGGSYREVSGLYRGADGYLAIRFSPGGTVPSKLEFRQIDLYPVFPVFYKYYDSNAVGTISIRNAETSDIHDVRVTLYVKSFMDAPKTYLVADSIGKGQELTIPLYALFNQSILNVTEGSKASAEIMISYKRGKEEARKNETVTLTVLYRNALTWDDDRKAASFVTARDPAILGYAKSIAGSVREADPASFNLAFRQAIAIFESLSVYGMNYVVDPASAYASLSADSAALDYLQFPGQTLSYRAGDCDDLTVLYCALLEAAGIETAFITVPGHIYAAFNIGISQESIGRLFPRPGDYIIHEGQVWIPLEITMIHDGFLRAWLEGSRQWREAGEQNTAALYPVREAWRLYEPTASIEDARVIVPDHTRFMTRYEEAWSRFVAHEIAAREGDIKETLARRDTPANRNRLGILYATYGLYDQAESQFQAGARQQDAGCTINLANIRFLKGNYLQAMEGYQSILSRDPANLPALVGASRTEYERENYASARTLYQQLTEADPALAARYSYIIQGTTSEARASSLSDRTAVEWKE